MKENRLVNRNLKRNKTIANNQKKKLITILLTTFSVFVIICRDKNLSRTKPNDSKHKIFNYIMLLVEFFKCGHGGL